jgi:hypothetical protein
MFFPYGMEKRMRFLRLYLIVAIIFALLGLLDSILTLTGTLSTAYTYFISILAVAFFIFNIVAVVKFLRNKLENIVLILPIYNIAMYIIFFAIGIHATYALTRESIFFYSAIVGLVTSLAELVFAGYLLRRFKFL